MDTLSEDQEKLLRALRQTLTQTPRAGVLVMVIEENHRDRTLTGNTLLLNVGWRHRLAAAGMAIRAVDGGSPNQLKHKTQRMTALFSRLFGSYAVIPGSESRVKVD